jgi:hypothetical protein
MLYNDMGNRTLVYKFGYGKNELSSVRRIVCKTIWPVCKRVLWYTVFMPSRVQPNPLKSGIAHW